MRYKQLGNTGLYVSELCLGTATFGDWASWAMGADQKAINDVVSHAFQAGVNFVDTADVYASGQSERLLGTSLREIGIKRSDVVIATKCAGRSGTGPNDVGASRAHIRDAVRCSLDNLGVDYIDLYQIHTQDDVTPVEETMRALDDLVSEGLVRYVGCSNWQAWKFMKALGISERRGWVRFEAIQAYYSVAGRDLEREIVPALEDQKVGLLVWSPLAGGLLSGKFKRDGGETEGTRRSMVDFPVVDRERAWACIDVMREIGDAKGVSVARVALAWLLTRPFVTSVILGAKTLEQLEDNLAAAKLRLAPEEIERIDEISRLPREYPGWFMSTVHKDRYPKAVSA